MAAIIDFTRKRGLPQGGLRLYVLFKTASWSQIMLKKTFFNIFVLSIFWHLCTSKMQIIHIVWV